MYVEHPYKFNDKFYAKVDGKFYEITREVAKAMLSAYRNEVRCYTVKDLQEMLDVTEAFPLSNHSSKLFLEMR